MEQHDKIFVAGHCSTVDSTLVRWLRIDGFEHRLLSGRDKSDLLDHRVVVDFLAAKRPDVAFVAAGKACGIQVNNPQRADFLYENLAIIANLIHNAGAAQSIRLGSSCIYAGYFRPAEVETLLCDASKARYGPARSQGGAKRQHDPAYGIHGKRAPGLGMPLRAPPEPSCITACSNDCCTDRA